MFITDVPYTPAQQSPIVLAQAATPSTPQPDFILKDCQETESAGDPRSAMRAVDPAGMLAIYLQNHNNRTINAQMLAAIKTTLLEGTTHGKIFAGVDNTGRTSYHYDAQPNYVGKDRAVFMAEFEGKRYKIVLELRVFIMVNEYNPTCPPPKLIKVNGKPVSSSLGIDLNNISVSITDLPNAAVGQTTGSSITLDTTAAGNGWFVDSTPADNSEFLPTSNPNEWIAKAGTAAAGKMDMLSVLLHEYGHALGIDHSSNPNDFMATTLTAGVRRLPSAAEMALMQQLIAQAKTGVMTAQTGSNAATDQPNNTPLPIIPLGGFGIAFAGLLQRNRYGGVNLAVDANTIVTQYAVAANDTLTNGSLNAADGWSTQGSVEFGNQESGGGDTP